MSRELQSPVHRILVALDNLPASLPTLEQAVALAAELEAEVMGIYVEDINLVRLAEFSFTEVGFFSGTSRRLEIRQVERQFRSQAGQVQQALANRADQAGVPWSFQVVRGNITAELLTAALEADLIILGRVGLRTPGRKRLGSTARAVLAQAAKLTLLLQPEGRLNWPVLVIYDGSSVAQRALVLASRIVPQQQAQISVLLLADRPEAAQQMQEEIESRLHPENVTFRYLWQSQADTRSLEWAIQSAGCQVLVLPDHPRLLDQETVLALLEDIDCPVLLVR